MIGVRLPLSALLFLLGAMIEPASAQRAAVYSMAKTGGNYMHNFYLPPPASTPWRPSFSPDGKQIAFSMAGSIWKIGYRWRHGL